MEKTLCEALPVPAWEGRQGAEAALVSGGTTDPLSPPNNHRTPAVGLGPVEDPLLKRRSRPRSLRFGGTFLAGSPTPVGPQKAGLHPPELASPPLSHRYRPVLEALLTPPVAPSPCASTPLPPAPANRPTAYIASRAYWTSRPSTEAPRLSGKWHGTKSPLHPQHHGQKRSGKSSALGREGVEGVGAAGSCRAHSGHTAAPHGRSTPGEPGGLPGRLPVPARPCSGGAGEPPWNRGSASTYKTGSSAGATQKAWSLVHGRPLLSDTGGGGGGVKLAPRDFG